MSPSQMRSPARRLNDGYRAEVTRNTTCPSIIRSEPEDDFAVCYVARRYRLTAPLARAIVELARIGERFA
jgi:hypothetical protein